MKTNADSLPAMIQARNRELTLLAEQKYSAVLLRWARPLPGDPDAALDAMRTMGIDRFRFDRDVELVEIHTNLLIEAAELSPRAEYVDRSPDSLRKVRVKGKREAESANDPIDPARYHRKQSEALTEKARHLRKSYPRVFCAYGANDHNHTN